jgi:hypothetical protein
MFGGKISTGINYTILKTYESLWEKHGFGEPEKAALRYAFLVHGEVEDIAVYTEIMEAVAEHWGICKEVIMEFEKQEKALKRADEWEPKVEKIKPEIKIEMLVILLLKEVFYRGYGTYYFNDKCNEILKLSKGGKVEQRKATETELELDRWRRIWYGEKIPISVIRP